MNTVRKIVSFAKNLGRDTRGEDLTEKSSGLSNAGKVVMAAIAITAAAAGATTLSNNSNAAGDHTSKAVNGATGASVQTTDKSTAPFAVK